MMISVIHETSSAFNSNLISTLYTRNSRTSFAPFLHWPSTTQIPESATPFIEQGIEFGPPSSALPDREALKNLTMVRSRIRYELVADERTRRETFKKRKRGLFKKLNELKVLCNIDVCGIVMNANGMQTEVWPSPPEASRVIQRFNDMPSSSKAVNMVDQIRYLRLNVSRMSTNVEKESRKVQSLEKELLLAECLTKEELNTGNSAELDEMVRLLERKIGMVDHRITEIGPSYSSMGATAKGRNIENYHGKGKRPL